MSNSISQAFKSLNVGSVESNSEHEHIYEVSYQYLTNVCNFDDPKALHNCLVALINLDRYHKAMELLSQVPEDSHKDFALEKAYIYYKTGNTSLLEDLYNSLSDLDPSSITHRALTHIVAQNAYKEGFNERALSLYHSLILMNQDIDNTQDLACNEAAVISQANFMGKETPARSESVKNALESVRNNPTYDYAFNESLILLSRGSLDAALNSLENAAQLCKQNTDASEYPDEVAPIKLSIAYIYEQQGKLDQSAEILDDFAQRNADTSDPMTKLVLNNNKYVSQLGSKDFKNANLLLRLLDYQPNLHKLRHKLTQPQIQALTQNNLQLRFITDTLNKTSSYFSSKFIDSWRSKFEADLTPIMYKLLVKFKIDLTKLTTENKKFAKSIFKWITGNFELTAKSHKDPEFIAAVLILVQLNQIGGNYNQSLSILEKSLYIQEIIDIKLLSPVLVGVLIKILEFSNSNEKLLVIYEKLTDSYLQEEMAIGQQYNLIKILAFKLLLVNEEKAKSIFNKLHKENEADELVASVLTGENTQLSSIEELSERTQPVESLLNVDIDHLVNINLTNKNASTSNHKVSKKITDKKKKNPKFSASKQFIPQDKFDESTLDKERWLPMTLRSYYKPTKKDKKKTGGLQGAVSSDNNSSKKKKKKGKK